MRPTIAEMAHEADVSSATVDRVMNARAGVHARTRARVLAAAKRLGYLVATEAQAPLRPVRLHFLLPDGTNAFIMELADQVRRTFRHPRVCMRRAALSLYRRNTQRRPRQPPSNEQLAAHSFSYSAQRLRSAS